MCKADPQSMTQSRTSTETVPPHRETHFELRPTWVYVRQQPSTGMPRANYTSSEIDDISSIRKLTLRRYVL